MSAGAQNPLDTSDMVKFLNFVYKTNGICKVNCESVWLLLMAEGPWKPACQKYKYFIGICKLKLLWINYDLITYWIFNISKKNKGFLLACKNSWKC